MLLLQYSFLVVVSLYTIWVAELADAQSNNVCESDECTARAKRILAYMDSTISPCDNFYNFACGKFVETATIRSDSIINDSLSQVSEVIQEQLKSILSEAVEVDESQPYKLVKQVYSLCMDEDQIDSDGLDPVKSLVNQAGGWPVLGDWEDSGWSILNTEINLIKLFNGGGSLFTIDISTDPNNSTKRVLQLDQPRFIILREELIDEAEESLVSAYYNYMVDIAVSFGVDSETASQQLKQSLTFEKELANISLSLEEHRNVVFKSYQLNSWKDKETWFDWVTFIKGIIPSSVEIQETESIMVADTGYFEKLNQLLLKYSSETIANYMVWRQIESVIYLLTSEQKKIQQEFFGTITTLPRWMECLAVVQGNSLNIALSSLYVNRHFDDDSKKEATEIVNNILEGMTAHIMNLTGVDETKRKAAIDIASRIRPEVGYPNELKDTKSLEGFYSDLEITGDSYFEAVRTVKVWRLQNSFSALRKPINNSDWTTHGSVAIVDVWFNSQEYSLHVPAGILQEPFFRRQLPFYVNYASIGYIGSTTIFHTFDYLINGNLTQGDSVASKGGLELSYNVYKNISTQLTSKEALITGLQQYSQDQLFFLSYANMMCEKVLSEETDDQNTVYDPSTSQSKVNGALMNLPEFSSIFQCGPNDPMNSQTDISL